MSRWIPLAHVVRLFRPGISLDVPTVYDIRISSPRSW